MSSSEVPKPNDLPFVIYPNSREDYRVTARSPGVNMPGAERLLDELSRRCGPRLTDEFSDLVGVVQSSDRPANLLAFRVFDVGQFMGRPHTLAIVAIEISGCQSHPWKIAQLLAALAPPVPDSSAYRLPTADVAQRTSVANEPFKCLADWEIRQGNNRPECGVAFSNPSSIQLQLSGLLNPPKEQLPTGWPIPLAISLIVVFSVVVFGCWWAMNYGQGPKPPPPSRYAREELLTVLADSGVVLQPEADFNHAAAALVATVTELNDRLRELANGLEKRAQFHLPPGDSAQELERHRERWHHPMQPEAQPTQRLDDISLAAAIQIHRRYQEVARTMDQLHKRSPDSADFSRGLSNLRSLLDKSTDQTGH
jgi:hypothetical protein